MQTYGRKVILTVWSEGEIPTVRKKAWSNPIPYICKLPLEPLTRTPPAIGFSKTMSCRIADSSSALRRPFAPQIRRHSARPNGCTMRGSGNERDRACGLAQAATVTAAEAALAAALGLLHRRGDVGGDPAAPQPRPGCAKAAQP